MKNLGKWVLASCLLLASTVVGQVMDGTLTGDESSYGAALSIQNSDTHFGDSNLGDPRFANGSEIDQVFGVIQGGRLHMLVTGNLESNFNKLEIFIDSAAGGVNSIDGSSLPATVDGFCCTLGTPNLPDPASGAMQRMNGLTFDQDFGADYYLTFSHGNEGLASTGPFWAFTAHYADLTQGTSGTFGALGMQLNPFGQETGLQPGELIDQNNNGWNGPDDPAGSPPEHEFVEPVSPSDPDNLLNHRDMSNIVDLRMGIDNSNSFGVNGSGGPVWTNTGDPENVVTGIEFSIPLSALGNATGDIRVTAFVNGGGHDYASNQVSGLGLAGAVTGTDGGNLGGDGFGGFTGDLTGVNFANIGGDQFVTIPAPTGVSCDLNGDGDCNTVDLRQLYDGIAINAVGGPADLDGSGTVDNDDIPVFLNLAGTENGKTYLPGDTNLNGSVEGGDFTTLAANFGGSGLPGAYWDQGNFVGKGGDGVFSVGGGSFTALAANFGSTSVSAVPEPSSCLLLVAALGSFVGVVRRRA